MEAFQFYKVNEVAKFAMFAVCAKYSSVLRCGNAFFFWAAIAVVEAKLEQFDDCLQDELSEMLPPHGYQIWFRVGRVSLSARSRPERFPCHGFPYPVSLVPFSLDYPIVSFLESCFPLNL